MYLFKYLQAKDIFEEFYTRRLLKRLLYGTSTNTDMELTVINSFKHECGPNFTRRADDIFRDISISSNHTLEFIEYYTNKK